MCVQYTISIEVSPRKVHPILTINGKFCVNPFKKNARVTTFEWSSMCLLSMHKFKLLFFSVLMDMEFNLTICLNSYHEDNYEFYHTIYLKDFIYHTFTV